MQQIRIGEIVQYWNRNGEYKGLVQVVGYQDEKHSVVMVDIDRAVFPQWYEYEKVYGAAIEHLRGGLRDERDDPVPVYEIANPAEPF